MHHPAAIRRSTLLLLSLALTPAAARAQFDLQDAHTTASLRGIHTVTNEVAWASGTDGTILRTTNGGHLWQTCTTPPAAEHLDFRGIQAFDENTAIIMSSGKGDLSRLYKTTDACHTWRLLFTNPDKEGFWDAIQFIDPKRFPIDKGFGMLVGDPVAGRFAAFLTFDGGDHWESQLKQAPPAEQGEGLFAASNSSLIVSRAAERAIVTGGPLHARILRFSVYDDDTRRSDDLDARVLPGSRPFYFFGKRRWDASTLPLATSASSGAFSIAEKPFGPPDQIGQHLVVVGGDYTRPESITGTAAYSVAGGFKPAKTPPHGYRSSVAYDPKSKTWITTGPNGTDISRDDGRNWTPLRPGPHDPPDADKNWNALSLPFVVGPHGRIGKLRPDALKP